METGKVQKNEYGNNVLVETESSSNRHYYHSNIDVYGEKLSDEEIKEAYLRIAKEPTIKEMKERLKKLDGYAYSNVTSNAIDYGDLFHYKVLSKIYFDGKYIFVLPKANGSEVKQFVDYAAKEFKMTHNESLKVLRYCQNRIGPTIVSFTEKEMKESADKWLSIIKEHKFPVLK